jgi:signal transduction histidine kinase
MIHLIEEMLDVSRIESGKLQLDQQDLDLVELTRDVIERFSDQFSALGLPIEYEGQAHAPVVGDRYRMEQVVANLLTNAIKYGSGKPIKISVESTGECVCLKVTDQGIGIAEEHLEGIFGRFERAISSNNISGLGLGLYISRQIVEQHGGRIWAESTLGKGSTFSVEIPHGRKIFSIL